MMGIPCDGPAHIFGDIQSVLDGTAVPDSTLKKKSQSIACHFVREGAARDEWRTTDVNTHDNEADLFAKLLPSGDKRRGFVMKMLHHTCHLTDDGKLQDCLGTQFEKMDDETIKLTQLRMVSRVSQMVGLDPECKRTKLHDTPAE